MSDPAVIFDMDGVLLNSHQYNILAINEVLGKYDLHISKIPDPHNQEWRGGSFKDLLSAIHSLHKIKLDIVDFAKEVDHLQFKRMELDEALLHKSLSTFLGALKASGLKVALCSSSRKGRIIKTLQLLDIRNHFEIIVSADDVGLHKPAPDCYRLACELLGKAPSQCIAIEDSLAGIMSAKTAGMNVIGFSMHANDDILTSQIDFHARHYDDLSLELMFELANNRKRESDANP